MNPLDEFRRGRARGWKFTALAGKRPITDAWPTTDIDDATLEAHIAAGGNIGLRTGAASGVYVVDIDPDAEPIDLPPTITVETGRPGGRHLYFRHPGNLGNSAGKLGKHIDTRGDGGQVVFVGSVHPITGAVYAWAPDLSPEDVDLAELPAWAITKLTATTTAPTAPTPARMPASGGGYGARALADECSKITSAEDGTRNNTLNTAALKIGRLVAGGEIDRHVAEADLLGAAVSIGLPENEARATIRSGMAAGLKSPRSRAPRPDAPPRVADAVDAEVITVGWIADRFVDQHRDRVRYVPQSGKWLLWDGKRWAEDDVNAVSNMAADVLRQVRLAAVDERDEQRRKRMFALGASLDSAAGYAQVLSTAATRPGICVRIADLDADPFLLNTQNCIVDLRTGQRSPHDPARLMTRITNAPYIPDAQSDLWDRRFLGQMLPDADLRAFVQRAAGYSLVGTGQDECLLIAHGPTASGKSTYADAIRAAAGDYAAVADCEAFLAKPVNGGARSDIARLAGKRIVIGSEVDEGARLAQGLIKALTGGDTITARFLYREPFEFLPTFVIWLMCNHAPRVPHDDDACWRRIYVIPFTVSLSAEERDPSVKQRLRTDPATQSAVLRWMVDGAIAWHRDGLKPPQVVKAATTAYRREQDELADFIADYCRCGPDLWVASRDLRQAYESYCRDCGVLRPMSPRVFWPRLTALGFKAETRSHVRGWRGITTARGDAGNTWNTWNTWNTTFGDFPRENTVSKVSKVAVPADPAVPPAISDEEMAILAEHTGAPE